MDKSIKSISILIPTYNDICVTLVKDLLDQCIDIIGLDFEILVGDDGSTSQASIDANQEIDVLPHCKILRCTKNSGRATTRNFLARKAQFPRRPYESPCRPCLATARSPLAAFSYEFDYAER